MKAGGHKRNAFLVLGMHRSGTSAFAGTLSHLGLAVPGELMAPNPANANGYFESWELATLHNRMLRTAGTRWDDASPIPEAWFARPPATAYVKEIVDFLHREFAEAGDFAIKDPRICRIVPIWRDALAAFGASMRIVLPLRHPLAIARSLAARDGLQLGESHLLWLRHLLDAERATREAPRAFVMFDDLLDDWWGTLDRVAEHLQITWPRDPAQAAPDIARFLDRRLRHHNSQGVHCAPGNPATALAQEGWQVFAQLTQRPDLPGAIEQLDSLRRRLDSVSSNYRMPLGLEAVVRPIIHLVAKSRVRRSIGSAEAGRLVVPKAGE
jgi:hypothetical protein